MSTRHDIEARCSSIQCSQQETRVRHVAVRYFLIIALGAAMGIISRAFIYTAFVFTLNTRRRIITNNLVHKGSAVTEAILGCLFFSFRVRGILGSREENTFPQIDLPLTETIQQVEYHHWDS